MLKIKPSLVLILLTLMLVFAFTKIFLFEPQKQIAITVDDLPLLADSDQQSNLLIDNITNALVKYQVPAIGFIIADRITPERAKQLDLFLEKGFQLGNHTFSHPNLRRTPANVYIRNIAAADQVLAPYMTAPKYFRYPHLAQGSWGKKRAVHRYLKAQGYVIAPVTIDSKDFRFNLQFSKIKYNAEDPLFKTIKATYLDFIRHQMIKTERKHKWFSLSLHSRKEILLLHANRLNGYLMDDVLNLFKKEGYQFISLDEALSLNQTLHAVSIS